jgi:hypothetical protein
MSASRLLVPAEGETIIQIESEEDDRGRTIFTMFWRDDRKPGGVAAQVFFANHRDYIKGPTRIVRAESVKERRRR